MVGLLNYSASVVGVIVLARGKVGKNKVEVSILIFHLIIGITARLTVKITELL